MSNAPILVASDYMMKVSVFEHNRDGKDNYSFCLQRSYKKKDTDEYVNETINLFPEDVLKMSHLLDSAYAMLRGYRNNKQRNGGVYTTGPATVTTGPEAAPLPQASLVKNSTDIPF